MTLLMCIGVISLLAFFVSIILRTYNNKKEDITKESFYSGYELGYKHGYDKICKDSFNKGYDKGFDDCSNNNINRFEKE